MSCERHKWDHPSRHDGRPIPGDPGGVHELPLTWKLMVCAWASFDRPRGFPTAPDPASLPPRDPDEWPLTRRFVIGEYRGEPVVFVDTPSTAELEDFHRRHPDAVPPFEDLGEPRPEEWQDWPEE